MKKYDKRIMLDLDGVISDMANVFNPFEALVIEKFENPRNREIFAAAIRFKMFEKLELMPNGERMLNEMRSIKRRMKDKVDIQILTATGTSSMPEMTEEVKRQKRVWLEKKGIEFPALFVEKTKDKGMHACPKTILIDDRVRCVEPFRENGGHAILYEDAKMDEALKTLYKFLEINAVG